MSRPPRPDKVHYIPPQRRKIVVADPLPPPHHHHASGTSPSAQSPSRHHRSSPQVPAASPRRNSSYNSTMATSADPAGVQIKSVRPSDGLCTPHDPYYTSGKAALKDSLAYKNAMNGKYGTPRINEVRPKEPSKVISSAEKPPAPYWMDTLDMDIGARYAPAITILRRQDHDTDEARPFNLGPRPEGRPAGLKSVNGRFYMGANRHVLTSQYTLEERMFRFTNSLNPVYPDPPLDDDPYEYGEEGPRVDCPEPGKKKKTIMDEERPAWMPMDIKPPTGYWGSMEPAPRRRTAMTNPARPPRRSRRPPPRAEAPVAVPFRPTIMKRNEDVSAVRASTRPCHEDAFKAPMYRVQG